MVSLIIVSYTAGQELGNTAEKRRLTDVYGNSHEIARKYIYLRIRNIEQQ